MLTLKTLPTGKEQTKRSKTFTTFGQSPAVAKVKDE